MDRAYVEVKIDTDRMEGGKALLERYREGKKGGIPWIAILDADGKTLATADGPGGNIGCPVTEEERAHFHAMLDATATKLTEAERRKIFDELDAFAEAILAKRG
jgi:hypothetical protein